MVPIITLLIVLIVSLLVVRVATVALSLTGLSQQLVRFQARSAFTGAGFTTTESEKVVQHPVRRQIIMLLMLLGNAGIVTAVSSLILTFIGTSESTGVSGTLWFRIGVLATGLAGLWTVGHSAWVDRHLSSLITMALKRWTDLEVRDYAGLLHLSGDYSVVEMLVDEADWLADRTLSELKLADEGVLVLGVEKADGTYFGAPRGTTQVSVDDTLIMYGPRDGLAALDQRIAGSQGNWEHHIALEQQMELKRKEEEIQQQSEPDSLT